MSESEQPMRLPHKPESLESARARVPQALARIWVTADVARDFAQRGDDADRPSIHREHVFDFDDGLRLVASVDRVPAKLVATGEDLALHVLHVSASFEPESMLWSTLDRTEKGLARFFEIAARRINDVFDGDARAKPHFFTGMVAHWFLKHSPQGATHGNAANP